MLEGQNERVELHFSCRKLKKRDALTKVDPQVKVFCQKQNERPLLGQTEVIKDTSNPNFSTTVVADFTFETQQRLIFEVYDYSLYQSYHSYEKIGRAETTLGKIVGAPKQLLILDIKNDEGKSSGKLIIQGEKKGESKNKVSWQWSGIKLMNTDGWFDKSDPFLRFMKIRGPGDYLQVYETEVIMDNLNPNWKPFSIMDYKLCDANYDKPFRIECWDWESDKKYQYIGHCEVTLNQLKSGKNMLELHNPKKKKSTGTLKLSNFRLQEEFRFIDYIRGGQQLKVFVGIDFTGSNKIVSDPTSLHTLSPNGYNQYQQAIYAVSQVLLNYDADKMVHVYGFGGIPRWPGIGNGTVSHCFPCTGNPQQPAVYGIEGIMNTYFHALQNVELSGPTYFSPLVHEVMQFCKFQKNQPNGVYSVLLILTDGDIHDMEQTINCLIESSHLPLSIVIVGVGNEDFKSMEILDGDHGLQNSKGQKAQRDLVQFVPFKKFQGDMYKLAQHVLAEVPEQLVHYMHLIGKKPNPPIMTNMEQLETSDRSFNSQPSFGSPVDHFGRNQFNFAGTQQQSFPPGQPHGPGQQGYFPASENQPPPMMPMNNQQNVPEQTGLKQSDLIHRYSLEAVVNPLQDKVNLNTFANLDNNSKLQQHFPGQQQGYPGYNPGSSQNTDPNMSLHCQIYPTFDSSRHPNQS